MRHAVVAGFGDVLRDDFQAEAAVGAGSGKDHADGARSIFPSQRIKQEIERESRAVSRLRLRKPQRSLALPARSRRQLRYPLSAIPGLFDAGVIKADVLMLQVSPPDADGRVSLGVSVDYMHEALRQRPLVIAEIGDGERNRRPHRRDQALRVRSSALHRRTQSASGEEGGDV